jgi:hypothetical protein
MKRRVLTFQIRKMIKNRGDTSPLSYQKAKCIGVIINNDYSWDGLNNFLSELEKDHDELHTIYFTKSIEKPGSEKKDFSPTDFNFFGQIKSDKILNFITPSFDYVFVLNKEPSLFIDFITVKAESKANISFYYEGGNEIADLQIKSGKSQELEDMLRYARKLS